MGSADASDIDVNEGFDEASVQRIFAPYINRRGLLVAVSGGPDSMALLRLAAQWAGMPERPRIFAATVDHGLRADSRAEAATVADWAAALEISHAILTWEGEKPVTRLQERAREARYALLCAHAAAVGADTLLTAHHADDQAETILFRLTRGSGVAGLAGMARERRRGGVLHARPLLDFNKADLVAYCETVGQAFVRDPSNANPRFARARLRGLSGLLEAEGLDRAALLRLGRRAERADEALSDAAKEMARRIGGGRSARCFSGDATPLAEAPLEIVLRFFDAELRLIAGAAPRLDRLETLSQRLQDALRAGRELRVTLAGARIVLRGDGYLTLAAERPRKQGR